MSIVVVSENVKPKDARVLKQGESATPDATKLARHVTTTTEKFAQRVVC